MGSNLTLLRLCCTRNCSKGCSMTLSPRPASSSGYILARDIGDQVVERLTGALVDADLDEMLQLLGIAADDLHRHAGTAFGSLETDAAGRAQRLEHQQVRRGD